VSQRQRTRRGVLSASTRHCPPSVADSKYEATEASVLGLATNEGALLLQLTTEESGRVVAQRTKNRSNTSPLPTVAAKCLAIDQVVFINAGDDTEQELRKWMEEHHIGEGSYTPGARLEATKRLQHLLELRGGAELEGGQTNIDLCCPVFTAKETEARAAADRDGGVTNGSRMAQRRSAFGAHGAMVRGRPSTCAAPTRRPNMQRRRDRGPQPARKQPTGGAGAGRGAAPVSPGGQCHKICAPEGVKGAIRRGPFNALSHEPLVAWNGASNQDRFEASPKNRSVAAVPAVEMRHRWGDRAS
jgi:hypothetical protein